MSDHVTDWLPMLKILGGEVGVDHKMTFERRAHGLEKAHFALRDKKEKKFSSAKRKALDHGTH